VRRRRRSATITPLPGSKLLGITHEDRPLDVTVSADQEPHLVGVELARSGCR
jgi:hypothetical protein